MSGTKLAIDGDIIVYRAAAAAQGTYYNVTCEDFLLGEFRTKKEALAFVEETGLSVYEIKKECRPDSPGIAISNMERSLDALIERVGNVAKTRIFLSDNPTFRHKLAVTRPYKGNRPDEKPVHLALLQQRIQELGAMKADGLEADDLIGIYGYSKGYVMASIDKDLLQIPGTHYNWVTDSFDTVDEDAGWDRLLSQLVTGDSVDNIVGLPGVGPAGYSKIIDDAGDTRTKWSNVVRAYRSAVDDWSTYLDEMGQLVYILRNHGDSWAAARSKLEAM